MAEERDAPAGDHCIVGHERDPRLLLVEEERGWTLLCVERQERGWFAYSVAAVMERVENKYGIEATVMRHLVDEREMQICELEIRDPAWELPDKARWIGRGDLDELRLVDERQRPILETWLAEVESGEIPALRPPWERRGWLRQALAWIDAQIEELGCALTRPVEFVKAAWSSSCILRVPTNQGDLYFKAVYAKPPGEVALISALAQRWPDQVPRIAAADFDRNWMLMRDFGDESLGDLPDARWAAAARLFAELQIDCTAHMDRWKDLGCPLRGPEEMPALFAQLLADREVLTEEPDPLSEAEIEQLHGHVPRIEAMCAKLASYKIPLSLHQQDFREGNLMVAGDTYLFYDWGDTVISHPFFSVHRMLDFLPEPEGIARWDEYLEHAEDGRRRTIRDGYLTAWTEYGSREQLVQAFALSRLLNEPYQAIRWYLEMPYLEPTSPWGKTIRRAPRRMLKAVLEMMAGRRDNS